MKNTTIAVDLAKSVFEIGISYRPGHVDQYHRVSRNLLSNFFAGQAPATVIMEACSSSHHWARQFVRFGHDVKLLPPFYVRLCSALEDRSHRCERHARSLAQQ